MCLYSNFKPIFNVKPRGLICMRIRYKAATLLICGVFSNYITFLPFALNIFYFKNEKGYGMAKCDLSGLHFYRLCASVAILF